jgi:hypothetical protein
MGYGHHRAEVAAASAGGRQHTGSLSRRMLLIAFAWVSFLLVGGGLALDHTLTGLVTRNFDDQLGYMLTAMIASAEIGPDGEVFFNRPLGDQRFLEPNSGLYWQISGQGHDDFPRARCGTARCASGATISTARRTSTIPTSSAPTKSCA